MLSVNAMKDMQVQDAIAVPKISLATPKYQVEVVLPVIVAIIPTYTDQEIVILSQEIVCNVCTIQLDQIVRFASLITLEMLF